MRSHLYLFLFFFATAISFQPCRAESVTIFVQNSQEQPVAGAAVELWMSPQPKDWDDRMQKRIADDSGKLVVEYVPEEAVRNFGITCKASGYTPLSKSWSSPKEKIPAECTLKLEKGISIGGVVVDEQGNPVPDVEIDFHIPIAPPRDFVWGNAKTDDTGTWRCDYFSRKTEKNEFYITFKSPDFKDIRETMPISRFTADTQQKFSKTVTLEKGCPFPGRVLDESGQPIAGAKVIACDSQDLMGNFYLKTTNKNGEFLFHNLNATNDGVLIVTATGFKTERMTPTAISESMEPFKVVLKPAAVPLKIKAVDETGEPIPGVRMYIREWSGLMQNHPFLLFDEGQNETDTNGMIVWNEAPADELVIGLIPKNEKHFTTRNLSVQARAEEYVFTLPKAANIVSKVYDSETKKPIPEFTLMLGSVYSPERAKEYNQGRTYSWMTHMPFHGADGSYSYLSRNELGTSVMKVEADGYRPMISRVIERNKDVLLEFPMQKLPENFAGRLAATVLTPDAQPLQNATVAVSVENSVPVENGFFKPDMFIGNSVPSKETDSQGRFAISSILPDEDWAINLSLPPEQQKKLDEISVPDYKIYVFHDIGFAEITKDAFEKSGQKIKIQPWAKVEGTLMLGSKSGKNQQIHLEMEPEERIVVRNPNEVVRKPAAYYRYGTATDENGKFRFDRVPPGRGTFSREIRYSDMMRTSSDYRTVTFEPGQTTTVQLGGVGRPVTGKLEVSGDFGMTPIWRNGYVTIISDIGNEKDEKKIDENYKTVRASAVARDGTFRVENVPSGKWNLEVLLTRNTPTTWGIRVGEQSMSLTVEEFPDEKRDEPLDVGTLNVKRVLTPEEKLIKLGAEVPDFSLTQIIGNEKGETVKLSELRGKTVILEFWATWCGPCIKKIPEVSAFYEKIKDNPNFVLLGISVDEEEETAVKFLEKRNMPWCQLRTDWPSPLTESLGFHGIPAMFVIDPQGRISMIDPSAEELDSLLSVQ